MKRGGPITPEEVSNKKADLIPGFVFDAFNTLITQNIDANGSSTVFEKEVVELIVQTNPKSEISSIYLKRWLDVEDVYRKVGWKVKYDKPAYCESYDAYFVFEK